jgi:hypothetical protein
VTHDESEQILAKIDEAIGKPEDEPPEEHERRIAWVERETLRRRCHRDIGKK